eukprot:2341722-Rhodomonas_salina.3
MLRSPSAPHPASAQSSVAQRASAPRVYMAETSAGSIRFRVNTVYRKGYKGPEAGMASRYPRV